MKEKEIVYMPMPVSLEEKRKLNAEGKKIIDIRFAPKGYEAPKKKRKPKAQVDGGNDSTN